MQVIRDKVVLYAGESMTADEYTAYVKILAAKPYLTTKEAAIFFDVGINRVRKLYARPEMAEHRIAKGRFDMLPSDVVKAALLKESEGRRNE